MAMTPLTFRKKILIGVVCGLVVGLVLVASVSLIERKDRADIKIIGWYYRPVHMSLGEDQWTETYFYVNLTNEGGSMGDATIRCSAQAGDVFRDWSTAVSMSPGEVRYDIMIYLTFPGWVEPSNATCALVTS